MSALYYRYWGKAHKSEDQVGDDCHLLPYHCLDVAAVGWVLMSPDGKYCSRLAEQLEVDPFWLQRWFSYCLSLHDVGKFSSAFQSLVTGLTINQVVSAPSFVYDKRHDLLGYRLCAELVKTEHFAGWLDAAQVQAKALSPWFNIACGHHGAPADQSTVAFDHYFSAEDKEAAIDYEYQVRALFMADLGPLTDNALRKRLKLASWMLAGIAVLADWLGSDKSVFHYQNKVVPLGDYWQKVTLPSAQELLKKAPLMLSLPTRQVGLKTLFEFIDQPSPLQAYAESATLGCGPQLFLLEDVTGAGKTEAALLLVQRLLAKGEASGLYVGLPTMATANGIYRRLAKAYRRLFAPEAQPSLVLAHGGRQLSKEFKQSVLLSQQLEDGVYSAGEHSASALCNRWLADSPKKALLAEVGVGTIDQALLAVLPARHQSLRLLGISQKVLLIDEVHAYDSYMNRLLNQLLEMHARQGGSAILLSATLPQAMRQELVDSFRSGRELTVPAQLDKTDFPLVTQVDAGGISEDPVATRVEVAREVKVSHFDQLETVVGRIRSAVQSGRSVCWVRNTVATARAAYALLAEQAGIDSERLHLFHSRFTQGDRRNIEDSVMELFGSDSTGEMRAGRVLVATQVVEQSLDLDFDLMITDLAPIDLIIQRAGRLQRHCRDLQGDRLDAGEADQRGVPELILLAPNPMGEIKSDWLEELLPNVQFVYPDLGRMWRTAELLVRLGSFTMPGDARLLIESVYGNGLSIPSALQKASDDAMAERKGKMGMAQLNGLRLDKGYCYNSARDSGGWDDEVHIPTRLSNETVDLVLARRLEGTLRPWVEAGADSWALSRLSIPEREWAQVSKKIPPELQQEVERTKEQTPELRWLELLPMTEELAHHYSASGGWSIDGGG